MFVVKFCLLSLVSVVPLPPERVFASIDVEGHVVLQHEDTWYSVGSYRFAGNWIPFQFKVKEIQAFDRDGNAIDARKLPSLLANKVHAFSSVRQKVHPVYLTGAGMNTIIFVISRPLALQF